LTKLIGIIFGYTPSSIEIVEPMSLELNINDANNLLNDFASSKKRSRYEKEWYMLFDDEREELNRIAKENKVNYSANKFEKNFFKRPETKIYTNRLENILGCRGLLE